MEKGKTMKAKGKRRAHRRNSMAVALANPLFRTRKEWSKVAKAGHTRCKGYLRRTLAAADGLCSGCGDAIRPRAA